MTDSQGDLDDLIDSTARRLTDADPPVELHGRVMARLGERRQPWTWRLIPAAALLLALVTIVVRVLDKPAPPEKAATTTVAGVAPAPALRPDPGAGVSLEGAPGSEPAGTPGAPQGRQAARRIADVHAEWQARALPALTPPQALTLERIQPDSLVIRPLETRPLVIAPIGADENR